MASIMVAPISFYPFFFRFLYLLVITAIFILKDSQLPFRSSSVVNHLSYRGYLSVTVKEWLWYNSIKNHGVLCYVVLKVICLGDMVLCSCSSHLLSLFASCIVGSGCVCLRHMHTLMKLVSNILLKFMLLVVIA